MTPPHTLRICVVDDEAPAREELVWLLEQSTQPCAVIAQANDAKSALSLLAELDPLPHVIFLDVDMPGIDGMRLASMIRERFGQGPSLVFVTAYESYALDAFGLEALDYLLKPVRAQRLKRVLERASVRHLTPPTATAEELPRQLDRISVESKGVYKVIPLAEVLCFEAHDGIVFVQTSVDRYVTEFSLKFLEQNLDTKHLFFRCHRSAIVQLAAIRSIAPWGAGTYRLVLDETQDLGVPLARSRASELKSLMPWSASALDD